MNKLCAHLPRLLLHLLLLPFVLLWIPLMFAMAWVHEAFEDVVRPAPVPLPTRAALPPQAATPPRH